MLLIHIAVALISIISSITAVLFPTRLHLAVSGVLAATTLLTGGILIATTQTNLAHACVSGVIYLCLVLTLLLKARFKLAAQSVTTTV